MIVLKKRDNQITVAGHAGYAAAGSDIVCAAASMLTYNLQASINELTEDTVGFNYAQNEMIISFDRNALSKKTQLLISSYIIGLRLLAANYPDYVKEE